jgi:hypothetical protein
VIMKHVSHAITTFLMCFDANRQKFVEWTVDQLVGYKCESGKNFGLENCQSII